MESPLEGWWTVRAQADPLQFLDQAERGVRLSEGQASHMVQLRPHCVSCNFPGVIVNAHKKWFKKYLFFRYDASHMGHARTYLTFDIVRRVIQNYFGYNIFYVMNITDIDDKIIKRARQNHLYDGYLASKPALDKVLTDCNAVLKTFASVVADTADPDKRKMQERQFKTLADAVAQVKAAFEKGAEAEIKSAEENLLAKAKDLLSDWLDKEQGSQVTDNAIFAKLPQFWEEEYHKDMEALNVSS